MRWSDVITLIAEIPPKRKTNKSGLPVKPKEECRIVFANKKSVGYSEFAMSHQAGIEAKLLFDVRTIDYNGERLLEHDVKRYKVYNTYVSKNGEVTELKVTDLPTRSADGGG